ncbi:GDSL-type esterase/lipase family protein [Alistipes sp. OttesenSCG-928-B03]|nr:GDSL-type esterase/lipase family protein [Alistipes sp. OttesenSCG-928-B03]
MDYNLTKKLGKQRYRIALVVILAAMVPFAASWMKPAGVVAAREAENRAVPDSLFPSYTQPEWAMLVDSAANVIVDSTGMLAPFLEKMEALQTGGSGTVSILHIGDSHIQAGFMTNRIREQFQGDFGNAGRGLIVPHRMARMNEARDYALTTPYGYKTQKATERGIEGKLGFTGIAVTFETPYNEFKIKSNEPFNNVTVFHHPGAPALCEPDELSIGTYCTIENTPGSTRINLMECVDSLMVSGFTTASFNTPTFYGFSLENGQPGVLYHAAGINGAAFEHFINNTTIAEGGAAPLCPDLIVVSLGTNNCFGSNFRRGQMYNCVDGFIRSLKKSYPGVPVLMTTPMESCNRKSTRGRRTYTPNPNVVEGAEVVAEAARDNEVAYWDFYNAVGGEKVMESWFAKGLANTDRIHLTEKGYVLQGEMFYEAFARLYNEFINREER